MQELETNMLDGESKVLERILIILTHKYSA